MFVRTLKTLKENGLENMNLETSAWKAKLVMLVRRLYFGGSTTQS